MSMAVCQASEPLIAEGARRLSSARRRLSSPVVLGITTAAWNALAPKDDVRTGETAVVVVVVAAAATATAVAAVLAGVGEDGVAPSTEGGSIPASGAICRSLQRYSSILSLINFFVASFASTARGYHREQVSVHFEKRFKKRGITTTRRRTAETELELGNSFGVEWCSFSISGCAVSLDRLVHKTERSLQRHSTH